MTAPPKALCSECKQILHRCIAENGSEDTQYFEARPWTSHLKPGADLACPICAALLLGNTPDASSSPASVQGVGAFLWNSGPGECDVTVANRKTGVDGTITLGSLHLDLQLQRISGKLTGVTFKV